MAAPTPSAKDEFATAFTNKLETTDDVDLHGIKLGHWAVGLFDCYKNCIPNGFMAFICPGISVAQIVARLGLMRYSLVLGAYAVLYLLILLTVITDSYVLAFFCVVAAVAITIGVSSLRTKMRTLFFIPGRAPLDLLSVVVCGPCTIAQMASHVEAYEPGTCSFRARSTLEGYVRA
ncbi:hypothetical protein PHYBOEH_010472 [Phytophthora boehmeriae]|uniref:Transmembrane protein n=1 Tax=Phytophthora boehmeriae TaxID=109152 RepID=A0A8T1VMF8_9STRA|nr:hypothetical protein PHYBOEH_010472 [Phytophthora boehmeriae]